MARSPILPRIDWTEPTKRGRHVVDADGQALSLERALGPQQQPGPGGIELLHLAKVDAEPSAGGDAPELTELLVEIGGAGNQPLPGRHKHQPVALPPKFELGTPSLHGSHSTRSPPFTRIAAVAGHRVG
jgi:hypothetical protein